MLYGELSTHARTLGRSQHLRHSRASAKDRARQAGRDASRWEGGRRLASGCPLQFAPSAHSSDTPGPTCACSPASSGGTPRLLTPPTPTRPVYLGGRRGSTLILNARVLGYVCVCVCVCVRVCACVFAGTPLLKTCFGSWPSTARSRRPAWPTDKQNQKKQQAHCDAHCVLLGHHRPRGQASARRNRRHRDRGAVGGGDVPCSTPPRPARARTGTRSPTDAPGWGL